MSIEEPEDPRTIELRKRMQREHDEIISGVGQVTRVWAALEESLLELFRILAHLTTSQSHLDIGGVIFYTPTNTETRVSLVNNLITYHCKLERIAEVDDHLVALWDTKIKGKIDNLKNTRNAIVHGTIVSSHRGGMDQRMRLSPTFGDTLRFQPFARRHEHPGLRPSDLKTHEQAVWRVIRQLQKLKQAFALRMRVQFGPDSTAAIQELLVLVPQLETEMSSQNNQDQGPLDKIDPSQPSEA